VPLRTSPFCKVSRNSRRNSLWVSSRNLRRDRTTLLRFLSSSITLHSSSRPTYGCRSRTRRISTSEAGRNPRRPMSMMSPPLTTSITRPVTVESLLKISSILPQARSYCARFLDRTSRPCWSSFCITRASTKSPTATASCGSTSCLIDSSLEGMTPSLLNPMSSSASSASTRTITPSTMSPSSKGLIVASRAFMNSSREPNSSRMTCSPRSRSASGAVSRVGVELSVCCSMPVPVLACGWRAAENGRPQRPVGPVDADAQQGTSASKQFRHASQRCQRALRDEHPC